MNRVPSRPRRWYQFKLSTILVLVGIAAWAMALRPWSEGSVVSVPSGITGSLGLRIAWDAHKDLFHVQADATYGNPSTSHVLSYQVGPRKVIWPLLALAAFLTWKLGWAIAARRKRRREQASEAVAPVLDSKSATQ